MMVIELKQDEFPRVLALYRSAGLRFPLISAVIQKTQHGQVFVDQPETPNSAMVVTRFGFTFFLGSSRREGFNEGIAELFAGQDRLTPTYLLWYSPPANWQARLDSAGLDFVKRRERVRFDFRMEQATWLSEPLVPEPGLGFENLTAALLPKIEKFGVQLDSRFWSSAEDFVENGLGVCLMKEDEVVSLCYAATVVDGLAEVDVVTDPEFRGRGLASVTTRRFIKECVDRGIEPTWDCFTYNVGSMKLASKLGFRPARNYQFYSFSVPLKL
jgi:RimJ/RimL family protein N-acetyltransferase